MVWSSQTTPLRELPSRGACSEREGLPHHREKTQLEENASGGLLTWSGIRALEATGLEVGEYLSEGCPHPLVRVSEKE